MRGDRTNYGKHADCLRATLRLYGEEKEWVERYAACHNFSIPDAMLVLIRLSMSELRVEKRTCR